MKRFLLLLLVAFALASPLVACGSSQSDEEVAKEKADQADKDEAKKREAEEAVKKKVLPICPQVAIVRELDTLRDYGTEKPDPSQVVAAARMQSVEGDCGYPEDGGIDITFDLHLIAQRGPRLGGNHESFPFFVAIVDPDQNIIDKNKLSTEFRFSDDPKKINDKTEHLHVFIPLPKDKRETGPNYRVLVGFQLTQQQLDAVREKEEPKAAE